MKTYQDPHTGQLWCEIQKGDTTVHRKAVVIVGRDSIHPSLRNSINRVEPELFEGERLFTTLTDMFIVQEQTNVERPRTSYYLDRFTAYDPDQL